MHRIQRNEVLVVEGKNDVHTIKRFFDIECMTTNGSAVSSTFLEELERISKTRDIIVFTDPDYPGERIRAQISERIEGVLHAYLPKEKGISQNGKKVGIEHATKEDLVHALSHVYGHRSPQDTEIYTMQDLYDFGVVRQKERRHALCQLLHIAPYNNKQLLKKLNTLAIEREEIVKALDMMEAETMVEKEGKE